MFNTKKPLLFENYFKAFKALLGKLYVDHTVIETTQYDDVLFDKTFDAEFDHVASYTLPPTKKESEITRLAMLPFVTLAKWVFKLRFSYGENDEDTIVDDYTNEPPIAIAKKEQTLCNKLLKGLGFLVGAVEVGLFSLGFFVATLANAIDCCVFKPLGLCGLFILSLCSEGNIKFRWDYYADRNSWLGLLTKAILLVFIVPVHALWHFLVSKPLSVVIASENEISKFLYIFGLTIIVGVLIGMSCGLGSVPVVAVFLAKMGFIQIAGDFIAASLSYVIAPITTVAIGDIIGLYFSWVVVTGLWKACASFFLKLISFGPLIKDDICAILHNQRIAAEQVATLSSSTKNVFNPCTVRAVVDTKDHHASFSSSPVPTTEGSLARQDTTKRI